MRKIRRNKKVRIVVSVDEFNPDEQVPELEKYGEIRHNLESVNAYSMYATLRDINKIRAYDWVEKVEHTNRKYPND